MSDDPERTEPDPGRKLMIVALVGIGILFAGVIVAMGYFAWKAMNPDGNAAIRSDYLVRSRPASRGFVQI